MTFLNLFSDRLIQSFSKLTYDFIQTNKEGDTQVSIVRCPQAMKSLKTIKSILVDYDNPKTRQLSIFISTSKMVRNNLTKLMSISTTDEAFMKIIIKIAFILLSPAASSTKDVLKNEVQSKRKHLETSKMASERSTQEKQKKANAIQQINALLSFKEDFSTDAFIKGLYLVIHKALQRRKFESSRSEDDSKIIELVLKVIAQLLSIDASHGNSTPSEELSANETHRSLLRMYNGPIFNLIVSFCSDLGSKEYQEYLAIFIDIIANIVRDLEPEALFELWRAGKVVPFEENRGVADLTISSSPQPNDKAEKQRLAANLAAALRLEESLREKATIGSLSRRRLQGVFQVTGKDDRLVKNPFRISAFREVESRRNKRNKLFSKVENTLNL